MRNPVRELYRRVVHESCHGRRSLLRSTAEQGTARASVVQRLAIDAVRRPADTGSWEKLTRDTVQGWLCGQVPDAV
ncbi:hypothetical protein OOK06_30725 [Streptomyces sp. NBC_00340]|uniref:hypothetical protein n=1 Tax=unclassified Streptomyces TaxID=2593676 RepID=UPI0022579804|nr:hypothetical protein [Streptomyces sp. NBC_00340]MCX5136449.1 hypothetical protein [Streptomyces sp. NBC_00340]